MGGGEDIGGHFYCFVCACWVVCVFLSLSGTPLMPRRFVTQEAVALTLVRIFFCCK